MPFANGLVTSSFPYAYTNPTGISRGSYFCSFVLVLNMSHIFMQLKRNKVTYRFLQINLQA